MFLHKFISFYRSVKSYMKTIAVTTTTFWRHTSHGKGSTCCRNCDSTYTAFSPATAWKSLCT